MKRRGPAVAMPPVPMLAARAQSPATYAAQRAGSNSGSVCPEPGILRSAPSATASTSLTRLQAEQMALKNNPRVSVSQLLALAQHQVVREARSAELPTANWRHHRGEGIGREPDLCRVAHRLTALDPCREPEAILRN